MESVQIKGCMARSVRRPGQPYLQREVDRFRSLYEAGVKLEVIADEMRTNPKSLWRLRVRLGLPERHRKPTSPSEQQIKKFKQMWAQGFDWTDICSECGISRYWLRKLRKQLGLPFPPRCGAWTQAQKDFLVEHWGELEACHIAERLGRTIGACYQKAAEWGLTQEQYRWPTHLIDRLISLRAQGFSYSEIARRFGLSKGSIIGKAHRLGICRAQS